MDFVRRRQAVFDKMEQGSIMILFSGIEMHVSADEYAKFESNRNFFYLTGFRREKMALILDKASEKPSVTLLIEEADPTQERWYGKKVTVEEAKEISQIDRVVFIDTFESEVNRRMTREDVDTMYFDTYRHQMEDLADYNLVKAKEFAAVYPGIRIKNAFPLIAELRMQKDEEEVKTIEKAIEITKTALEHVMSKLKPGMKEYQAQAEFEYKIHYEGADGCAFPTIAGSGINGTMLHYDTNQDTCEDNTLILMDLGAKYQGYCADITRTYPVSGKFTKQQREVYDVVLEANQTIAKTAKPGMTTLELNNICKKVLAEGCIRLGLIEKEEEIGKYYMHGVSHHLGIDVHDVTVDSNKRLRPGAVITNEPGLYIDEWKIGIRIEDDLLITEDGCRVLSKDVIRTAEEIESFMRGM